MTTITHKDYQAHVDQLHASRYMSTPMEVAIETQTVCNAACEFCPYPSLERIGNKMPDELVAKIIDDMRAFPADLPFIVSPFKVNDPLLDVRIFDICAEINRSLPQARVRMFTNGSPLTPGAIEKIARIERLEHLWISLNHYKPEAYATVMGAGMKLSRTLSRVDGHPSQEGELMDTITRAELVALGGDPDATYAAFYPDGSLYFTTTAPEAAADNVVLLGEHCPTKRVINQGETP